jgi:hypothetical protein
MYMLKQVVWRKKQCLRSPKLFYITELGNSNFMLLCCTMSLCPHWNWEHWILQKTLLLIKIKCRGIDFGDYRKWLGRPTHPRSQNFRFYTSGDVLSHAEVGILQRLGNVEYFIFLSISMKNHALNKPWEPIEHQRSEFHWRTNSKITFWNIANEANHDYS